MCPIVVVDVTNGVLEDTTAAGGETGALSDGEGTKCGTEIVLTGILLLSSGTGSCCTRFRSVNILAIMKSFELFGGVLVLVMVKPPFNDVATGGSVGNKSVKRNLGGADELLTVRSRGATGLGALITGVMVIEGLVKASEISLGSSLLLRTMSVEGGVAQVTGGRVENDSADTPLMANRH